MGKLRTRTAGSRLAIVLTTVIVTTAVLAGGVALASVGFNSVGSPQIKNGSIRSVDIATGGIKTVDIANGTIGTADIRNGAVRGLDIRDGTIRGADIADGQITSAKIANGTIAATDLAATTQPAGVAFAEGDQLLDLTLAAQSVRDVVLDAPAPGHVIVTASGNTGFRSSSVDQAVCSITDGAVTVDPSHSIVADDDGVEISLQVIPLSGTRTFAVAAGPTTFRLVCQEFLGSVVFADSQITALYVPALYAP